MKTQILNIVDGFEDNFDDSDIDESTLQKILDQIIKDEISIQSVEIEN